MLTAIAATGLTFGVEPLLPSTLKLEPAGRVLARADRAAAWQPPVIDRFPFEPNPIALTGPARATRYMEASGRRAAFLGREDGSFEAWVYPLKVLHDFQIAFGTPAYAEPIPAASLAADVDIRPESSTVRYAHAAFTVDATWFVPRDEPGGLVLLDIRASEPLTLVVKFRIDLKPMWPAALGGQYSYWNDELEAYVVGEGSGKHAALVGSPFALKPPEQPAHNLPDAPSQFTMAVTPDVARAGLVPIVVAASAGGLKEAQATYQKLLASAASLYRDTAAHYRRVREELASIDTPDDRLDLALEWGKVALDKGFVCNPHLGCGLIAGLGPSGTTERPGFGWFFGGDAFINMWAMTAYGDVETVKPSLEFLRARQRADGKMMHELSQGAAYIRWFEDYPYGYYHADTTPLYIMAVRDYVRASGDVALAKDFWPSIRKAYDYCASTDEDGDGLMDNTRAGLAAVETGALRRRDVLTDVFLATVWTDATAAAAELAAAAGDPFSAAAQAAHEKARASLNRRFLDDEGRRVYFAIMKDGKGQAEATVWPAVGLWRGVFERGRPAVEGMLDQVAGPGIAADWGARMLSRDSALYQPLSYNNGAVWPFLSGFAIMALYENDRAPAAWAYLDGTADLTRLEARGYLPELLSGDRLRSVDAAVPHQLFATSGFVSGLMRGLVGLAEPPIDRAPEGLRIAPKLPPGWDFLRVRNLRWRGARVDVEVARGARGFDVILRRPDPSVPVTIVLTLPPGGEFPEPPSASSHPRGVSKAFFFAPGGPVETRRSVAARRGIEIVPEHGPLRLGDPSQRLRVIDARLVDRTFTAKLAGRAGRSYRVRLDSPFEVVSVSGAERAAEDPSMLLVTFPSGATEWAEREVVVTVGRRRSPGPASARRR